MSKLRVEKIAAPIIKDEFTGSVFFDGSDYLEFAQSTDLSFGTGDYTVECWIHPREVTSNLEIVLNTGGKNNNTFYLHYDQDQLSVGNQTAFISNQATVFENDTWYHIVAARQSGVLKLFRNGVQVGLDATDTTDWASGGTMRIGLNSDGSQGVNGYISNLRVCKGHAVYFSNFTPPTRQLVVHKAAPRGVVFSAADNVTTLLACQSATDATIDASGRHTLTVGGSAHAQSANPGLLSNTNITSTITENTGSVAFDGTGDYLSVGDPGDDFDLAGDFTVEFWVYFNSLGLYQDIIGTATNSVYLGSGKGGWVAAHYVSMGAAKWHFSYQTNSSWTFENHYSFTASANTWYHVAFTREGSDLKCYVDGVQRGSTISTSTNLISTEKRLSIGAGHGANAGYLNGHVSNVRICKGHAVYTSNFVPPTRELEVHQGPDDDRTVLLACYDGENVFAEKTGKIVAAYGDRTSSPTPTATDSPIGITTNYPPITRNVDPTDGPTFQGGAGFTSQNWLTLPKGTTEQRQATGSYASGSTRAVAMGGNGTPSNVSNNSVIDYINVETLGNAAAFGSLGVIESFNADAVGSRTRGVVFGGRANTPTPNTTTNTMQYITFMSTGNSLDFGDLSTQRYGSAGFSDSTRGISSGGGVAFDSTNAIDYITISTLGNSKDFGDCILARTYRAGFSSPTRGISAGGGVTPGSGAENNSIEYVTIQTTGNGQDFGDLVTAAWRLAGCSNAVRGVILEGETPAGDGRNAISYVTISTMGNAQEFGDATTAGQHSNGTASSTRGVFMGRQGASPYANLDFIDYVHIMTTGNAVDFGNLTAVRQGVNACSNGHGGLG